MTIYTHKGDLPDNLDLGPEIAVDTETLGLNPHRDRLCVVQISNGNGDAHLVQLKPQDYEGAKNLKALMTNKNIVKIFHFARFDIAVMKHYMGIEITPVFCTKIASKLARTYTDRHGLKDLTKELLDIDLDKTQQSSDWAADDLSDDQKAYAASDVLYLHQLKSKLIEMLERENRLELAECCFDFLPTRADLDLIGWSENDIFAHR